MLKRKDEYRTCWWYTLSVSIWQNEPIVENSPCRLELDELYRFLEEKPNTETRANVYVMTAVIRNPCMILGFDVAQDKTAQGMQGIIQMDTVDIWM